jgi:PhoH-like ATPase
LPLDLKTNQYLIIRDQDDKIIDKYFWNGKSLEKLKYKKNKDFKPKTYKQECCFDLLSRDDIKVKIMFGCAGSGKTKMALRFGFEYLKEGKVNKIFIIRHNVSVGEKNGFLKGTKEEKIMGWLGCIKDNIDDRQESLEQMIAFDQIEVEAVEYIKGRDIKNSWIIIDEAEDLTEEQFQVIGERVSEGSYICFIGDVDQTSQKQYKENNGYKRAINNLAGDPLVGIVGMEDKDHDNVRSGVSKLFTYKY